MATAISKTIMHKVWFAPVIFITGSVRVDNDLVAKAIAMDLQATLIKMHATTGAGGVLVDIGF